MTNQPLRRQFRVQLRSGDTLLVSRVPLARPAALDRLSLSEREVVDLVLEGCSNAEIALRRRTSVHTVANQLKAAFRKLGCSGRCELIALVAAAHQAVIE